MTTLLLKAPAEQAVIEREASLSAPLSAGRHRALRRIHTFEIIGPYHRAHCWGGQSMSMIDLIRNADSEVNIYALLTSYIDALGHSDKGMLVAQSLLALPIYGAADLQARYSLLLAELDLASRRLDHQVCIVYKEALAILATALHCIRLIKYSMRNECFLS